MSDVKFIRKNGRIIPVRGKSKGAGGKPSGNLDPAAKKAKAKETSKKLSYAGGALSGISVKARLTGARKTSLGFAAGAFVANTAGTIKNIQGSTGIGNFVKTEIGNSFRGAAGAVGSFGAASVGISRGAKAVRRAKHMKVGTVDVLDSSGKVIKARASKVGPWRPKLK